MYNSCSICKNCDMNNTEIRLVDLRTFGKKSLENRNIPSKIKAP